MKQSVEVLYEDNHIIIINKQSGEIVQGDKTGDIPLSEIVAEYLKEKYNKPGKVFVGVIHRLDRPVSGAIIFAKTSKALARMNALVEQRKIRKIYWAIVLQAPEKPEATLVNYLKKNEQKNKSYVTSSEQKGSSRAELTYKHIASSDKYHLLEVELHTGRHHQIRVQLSAIGCVIKGDLKYGAARSNPDASISLHARILEFEHPVSNELIKIVAPVPKDNLWKYFEESSL